jgi:dolichyl-phosphate beta-glucosyltransferase
MRGRDILSMCGRNVILIPLVSMASPFLSLVIPAYNEALRLPDTLSRCLAFLESWNHTWEIVVVDDGSIDRTASIVEEFHARDERVRLVRGAHQGKGSAVRTGMLSASGHWRFFADADLSMDLSELPKFFDQPADVALASREAEGAQRIGEPFGRHLVGRIFNLCVRALVVPGIHDTQCGYKLFSEEATRALFSASRVNGFAFDVELIFLARRAGLRVREIPIVWRHKPGSRVRMRSGLDAFRQLLEIRRNAVLGHYDGLLAEAAPARRAGL